VSGRVHEHRLLAEQQEHGEQQVHQRAAGVHGAFFVSALSGAVS
jgi:hypothetical protein